MSKKTKIPLRPVGCGICGGQMYYSEDARHVPELRVVAEFERGDGEVFYAHAKCWQKIFGRRRKR